MTDQSGEKVNRKIGRPDRPLPLRGVGKNYLWGGHRLREEYGQNDPENPCLPLAESWVCSTHPDGESRISAGPWEGMTLGEILRAFPEVLGRRAAPGGDLPVLVKLIDARDDLSLQVHPDDAYARENEGGQSGKTEMWYVLEAEAGASMRCGFLREMSRREVRECLEQETLLSHVRRVPVRRDDVLYIGAGTIHAGGAGTVFAEIQENSDLTYRLYDYGRRDGGRLRELHPEKALDVLDYRAGGELRQPMRQITYSPGCARELVSRCACFEIHRLLVNVKSQEEPFFYRPGDQSFRVLLCIEGGGRLHVSGPTPEDTDPDLPAADVYPVDKGSCFFVPAGCPPVCISGKAIFLEIRC